MSSSDPRSVALFFQQGSSDKEYHVHLKSAESDLWLVEIQYGKRGSALRSALKTKDPIERSKAEALYEKIVAEQLRQGYTAESSGIAFQSTPRQALFTGILPQLLNPIDEAQFESILSDDDWILQEKFDGQRLLLRWEKNILTGINRDGLAVAVPQAFETACSQLDASSFVLDAEWLGDRLAVFDLLELDGVNLRSKGALQRKLDLDILLRDALDVFIPVITAVGEKAKRELYETVRSRNGEGVVGKLADAPYEPGRPNSGGNQLKRKFVESATVRVSQAHPTKRSVSMELLNEEGQWVDVGSVTIPVNHSIPQSGQIVEVYYLYAYRGGSLYQPVYKGPRSDQGEAACSMGQLKYKADGPATAPKPF